MKRKSQPRVNGVIRVRMTPYIHPEVLRNLHLIADSEAKSLSYVVAEIIYDHFGLKVTENIVRVRRRRRAEVVRFEPRKRRVI